ELVEKGEPIIQETRSFDAGNSTTFSLRNKEEANDYRYFPDPDLAPFIVTEEMVEEIRKAVPEMPEQRARRYMNDLQLPEYDARVICDEKETADFFETILQHTANIKGAANLLLGPVKGYLNEKGIHINEFPVPPSNLAGLLRLVEENKVNFSMASTRLLQEMIRQPGKPATELATDLNLIQDSDDSTIEAWVEQALNQMPDKVTEYRKGKKGLIGLFVGEVKKLSKGKADPKKTNELLIKKLEA
ncbi:MAG TPA: hypothetical protein VLC28_10330, partial [Flavitalea sp.]|nr:hypothetical protein [Flavitalea sp.]